ncbi:DUF87 domain-containing protein [Exiguobacterium sp. s26]|uniref:ATP-binding protein n=1 Tax=Exiguobacterium sp. s26 TaxID=2751231 RepID=UPI001BE50198|nr:DUF87 domain-containing protein [Exiguobacterium sp. s26]
MNDLTLEVKEAQDIVIQARTMIEKHFLQQLDRFEVCAVDVEASNDVIEQVRFVEIEKIVYEKDEPILEKLTNIYNTIGILRDHLALIINSDGESVRLFVGIRSDEAASAQESLVKSLRGNLPGTKFTKTRNSAFSALLDEVLPSVESPRMISSVTGIPSLKDPDQPFDVQGLERLINAMHGEPFSAVFLAECVTPQQVVTMRQGYEEMYTSLSRYQKATYSEGKNDSYSLVEGISEGISDSLNESIGKTQTHTTSQTEGSNSSHTGSVIIYSYTRGRNTSETESSSDGETRTNGTTTTTTKNISTNETHTEGSSKTLQLEVENKQVQEILKKIDVHLERLNEATDFGLWNYSAYFIADDEQTARVAAANYQSLIRGKDSSIEGSAISVWGRGHAELPKINQALRRLEHPLFMSPELPGWPLTSGSLVNTRELSIALTLPRKSTAGLPVVEMADFGRSVAYLSAPPPRKGIEIGKVYHMGESFKTPLHLHTDSLAMHTFITGSTGSGKSNTVYRVLGQLVKEGIKFLVIEPAKGEYKHVFSDDPSVRVFGTNQKHSPLLRINPFRFPDSVHVLEHIERLIEIFNACWPMYAAMPAILREAVEEIYRKSGWNLEHSISFQRYVVYPSMTDLVRVLPEVIERSGYSEEVKSNYVGALVTRVRSLTTGLLSKVLVADEIDSETLFDENCIVDLSLVGSTETKSLMMGILFMRLQEHRTHTATTMNSPLKHVTVLEEAHHLLKKTTTDQSTEGSNLQGKSIEMITNGIAEMRTFGEGFILVDQSPNLLDPSAIRNTNTKIIMRLPDLADRQLVGTSAGLNDQQLNELARLETGVAAVYQNNWLEPVLCKVSVSLQGGRYEYTYDLKAELRSRRDALTRLVGNLFSSPLNRDELREQIRMNGEVRSGLREQLVEELSKDKALTLLEPGNEVLIGELIGSYLPIDEIISYATATDTFEQFDRRFKKALSVFVEEDSRASKIQEYMMLYHCSRVPSFHSFYKDWYTYKSEGESS